MNISLHERFLTVFLASVCLLAGQPVRSDIPKSFSAPLDSYDYTKREVMIPFKCDVHNWMQAYIGVLDHPYFAVTHDGGNFELKNLPEGTYTVEAWHEKLGTQAQTVTLGEKESKELTFTFKAAAAASSN